VKLNEPDQNHAPDPDPDPDHDPDPDLVKDTNSRLKRKRKNAKLISKFVSVIHPNANLDAKVKLNVNVMTVAIKLKLIHAKICARNLAVNLVLREKANVKTIKIKFAHEIHAKISNIVTQFQHSNENYAYTTH